MIHLYFILFIAYKLNDYIDKINYLLYLGNIKTIVVAVRACTLLYCLPLAPHGGDTTKLLHAKGLAVPSSPYIVFATTPTSGNQGQKKSNGGGGGGGYEVKSWI